MLGMSPDGILHTSWQSPEGGVLKLTELIEYKCPATWEKKRHNPNIYKQELVPKLVPTRFRENLLARGEITADGLPLCEGGHRLACPPYYYAQVQYGMQLFKCPASIFRSTFCGMVPGVRVTSKSSEMIRRQVVDSYARRRVSSPVRTAIVRQLRGGSRREARGGNGKRLKTTPRLNFLDFL